jgi:hypothetical protein
MIKTNTLICILALSSLTGMAATTTTNSPAPGGIVVPPSSMTPLAAPPDSNTSFFNTVASYFTSFNPALEGTFTNKGSAWVSVISAQSQSVPLQNEIGFSYQLINHLQAEAEVRDGGVTGAIISMQGGVGVFTVVHDVKLTAFADGGYNISKPAKGQDAFAEIGLRAAKALTTYTYAGVQASFRPGSNDRFFGAMTGFMF